MNHYVWDWYRFGFGIQVYKNTEKIVACYIQFTFLQLYIILHKAK